MENVSREEIRQALIAMTWIVNSTAQKPEPDEYAIDALASGDTSRSLVDWESTRDQFTEMMGGDRELAAVAVMVGLANAVSVQKQHADFWRFYGAARDLMLERQLGDWVSLVMVEDARLELYRRWSSPEEQAGMVELAFRVVYRTQLNSLAFGERRSFDRLLGRVSVWTVSDRKEPSTKRPLEPPSEDTIALDALSAQRAHELEGFARAYAEKLIVWLRTLIYSVWGETGYAAVRGRLTVDHFVAQAQEIRAN